MSAITSVEYIFFPHRKSSTVPDGVAMAVLTRNRPSPVIQVTVKQTETDTGLIGVSGFQQKDYAFGKIYFYAQLYVYPLKNYRSAQKWTQRTQRVSNNHTHSM